MDQSLHAPGGPGQPGQSENGLIDLDIDRILDASFWRALNPALHVEDQAWIRSSSAFSYADPVLDLFTRRMRQEGYFEFFVPQEKWQLSFPKMAASISTLLPLGLWPVFSFVYDEFWLLFSKQSQILSQFLGSEYKMLPDFWTWHVDPATGGRGWKPHRDRGWKSLDAQGHPKSLTVWIPLTLATPMNGCLYLVPADKDPCYNTPKENGRRFKHADIRALPGLPGNVFCWNQCVLHWGGSTSPFAEEPRISVAFEFQRADVEPFNTPLLDPHEIPSLKMRLLLIAKQTLQYIRHQPLNSGMKCLARALLDRNDRGSFTA